jgi:hypothetical protein
MTQPTTFALRIPASLKGEAERLAKADGTSLNQYVTNALAEKVAAQKTAAYFEQRIARAREAERRGEPSMLEQLLNRPGGEPPRPGDELPEGYVPLPRGGAKARAGKPPAAASRRKAATPAGADRADLSVARTQAAEPTIAHDDFVAQLARPAAPTARRRRGASGPAR